MTWPSRKYVVAENAALLDQLPPPLLDLLSLYSYWAHYWPWVLVPALAAYYPFLSPGHRHWLFLQLLLNKFIVFLYDRALLLGTHPPFRIVLIGLQVTLPVRKVLHIHIVAWSLLI